MEIAAPGSRPFFQAETANFLSRLALNNNRPWFKSHQGEAERWLMAPARALVGEVGGLLKKRRPALIADPRIDRSIYRLNRDIRFSRDKAPYKTHLALWWWEGGGARLESPGFYFHLTAAGLIISGGLYRFSPAALAAYRQALLHKSRGARFLKIVEKLEKDGHIFNQPELKRVPSGFEAGHPAARWLRHKGLYTWMEQEPWPQEITGPEAPSFIAGLFEPFWPLHEWLAAL